MKTQTFLYALAGTTGTIDRGIVQFENKPFVSWTELVREMQNALDAAETHREYPVTDVDRAERPLSETDTVR